jgi:rRNA processing protein Krr1/Pno1
LRLGLNNPQAFIVRKKERLVLPDGTADAAAELVLTEFTLLAGQGVARLGDVENVFCV